MVTAHGVNTSVRRKKNQIMKVKFIGQGLNSSNDMLGPIILQSIKSRKFQDIKFVSAFSSSAIFEELKDVILDLPKDYRVSITVGIDQQGTSFEALAKLISLQVDSYVYYSISNPIFHPKCYIFKGKKEFRLIVGSNNLTINGFFNNVENAVMIDSEYSDEGLLLLAEVEDYYSELFNEKSANLKRLDMDLIRLLRDSNLVPSKEEQSASYQQTKAKRKLTDTIKSLFPKLAIKMFRGRKKPTNRNRPEVAESTGIVNDDGTADEGLLWEKINLPASDVEHVQPGTNPTGRLKLVKAGHDIDQTTYFRYEVFQYLVWTQRSNSEKQDATAKFRLIIGGTDHGIHELLIMHDPRGEASQNNYTTSISWTGVSGIIRESDLRGMTLRLFKNKGLLFDFTLQIV